jgi:catechol 2,3-dioxygenase-like lactoylglutathione lyase family enzyme
MAGAPLPLLGTFHEISIAPHDIRAAVGFYESLGFTQATTSDAFSHPYGVVSDGRLSIGLHRRAGASPTLTFVRPGIARLLAAFASAGIALTTREVGEEVFNRIGFADPSGHAVAVLEARTYSPVARTARSSSLCGDFAEVSLPASDFAAAQAFWEPLGFVAAEESHTPYPHLSLTSDYLDLAFHPPRLCERPMLVFRDAGLQARIERLQELAVPSCSVAGGAGVRFEGPDGTPLLLLEEPG